MCIRDSESDLDLLAVPDAIAHNIKRLLQPPYDPLWAWVARTLWAAPLGGDQSCD